MPILWFKIDHRINVLEQPRAIRITQHGRSLTATLVYEFPNYQPSLSKYQSCGINPGVVQRLTIVNDQHQYTQIAGADTSQHRKTLRRLRCQMQRCRTHFMANLLTPVPKRAQPGVATMVRTIYQQLSPAEVHGQLDRVVEQLREPFPQVANCWRTPRRTLWPSRPSQWPTGRSCGPTTHRNG